MNGSSRRRRLWDSTRSTVVAIVIGLAILVAGGAVSGALMIANLQLAPKLPLFFPGTVVWLWLFWRHARGDGWPKETSRFRRESVRASHLSARAWVWALLAGGLALTAVMGVAFAIYGFASLPEAAYSAPFEIAGLPPWTLVSVFASLALTAGVVEETAFRGYMLSSLERQHGWAIGIGLVTAVFYVSHLSHAYATVVFMLFFVPHGVVFGLLVYYTRSILPGIVLHAVSDFVVLPMQYNAIASVGQWAFVSHGWLSLVATAAAIPAFRQLSRTMRIERSHAA
jgi:membrane protease YdiL (CAAX protease family)